MKVAVTVPISSKRLRQSLFFCRYLKSPSIWIYILKMNNWIEMKYNHMKTNMEATNLTNLPSTDAARHINGVCFRSILLKEGDCDERSIICFVSFHSQGISHLSSIIARSDFSKSKSDSSNAINSSKDPCASSILSLAQKTPPTSQSFAPGSNRTVSLRKWSVAKLFSTWGS